MAEMVILRGLSLTGQNGGNFRGIPQLVGGECKERKQGSTKSSREKEEGQREKEESQKQKGQLF